MPGAISPAALAAARTAPAPLDISLRVNGMEHRLSLDSRTTLLDALREHRISPARRRAAASASAVPARS